MADMAGTIWTAILAKYTADTGASGLNNTSSANNVIHFVRRGDPNFDMDRRADWPNIVVDIFNTESRVFGLRRTEALVRMHLYTHRDTNTSLLTTQDGIGERIYAVFDGATLSTQGTTEFAIMNQVRDFQGPSSGIDLHRVYEFTVNAIVQSGA